MSGQPRADGFAAPTVAPRRQWRHAAPRGGESVSLVSGALMSGCREGGGEGTRDIYWWGCALAHQKRGVLRRCGHSPKRGVLGAGTAQKKGGLRCGHNQKKGSLGHVYNTKKGEFMTDLVKREGVMI